jgi:osmotically inducible protein OsmC
MPERSATAEWSGDLAGGEGKMEFGSGAFEGAYSAKSRFEEGEGTNPEELIAAAHAGCFSMAFANELSLAGHVPDKVSSGARVVLKMGDDGPVIERSELTTKVSIDGIEDDELERIAEGAKENCPVSVALRAIEITLDVKRA